MTVEQINKEWGDKFMHTFTSMDAALVFAIALTKDNKVRMCCTTDVQPAELKVLLKKVIDSLGG